jgi:1,4-dihydroxy-2-naphthoyl-CoA synthase
METSFSSALDSAGIAAEIAIHSSDADEGKTAFREKRPPRFTGR